MNERWEQTPLLQPTTATAAALLAYACRACGGIVHPAYRAKHEASCRGSYEPEPDDA